VIHGAICEWDAGRRYLNFTESAVDTRRAYSERAYRRLRAVKTLVDPDDVFRANHAIAPID
jgi:FAD/FMN-containing dehydrogenase